MEKMYIKDLDKVSNVTHVAGIDVDGNSVLIDPANLPRSLFVTTDLNDIKYNANIAFSNTCSNTPFPYGFLLVSVSVVINDLLVLQTAYGREDSYGKVSYRIYRESKGWGDWKIICAG